MKTIDDVLARLDAIVASCVATNSRQAYFAVLYRQMTAAVKDGIHHGVFEDGARMEKLDVLFASRYVDAWENYRNNKPTTRSWNHVFCAADNRLTVIQHLLLGMNTHINLDLAIAAAGTCPGNAIFGLEKDFTAINTLISTLAGSVQQKLDNISRPMKMLDNIANGSEKAVLNFSVTKARQAAWANGVALALASEQQQEQHIQTMDAAVYAISRKIESPGFPANMILPMVQLSEPNKVSEIVKLLQ